MRFYKIKHKVLTLRSFMNYNVNIWCIIVYRIPLNYLNKSYKYYYNVLTSLTTLLNNGIDEVGIFIQIIENIPTYYKKIRILGRGFRSNYLFETVAYKRRSGLTPFKIFGKVKKRL